jgi:chromosomal replication initiator protein
MGTPNMPKDVIEFLAHRITSNVRELEMALNRVTAHSTLVGRAISLEMTQEVLRDVLRASDRRITIDEIQRRAAEHWPEARDVVRRRARAVARRRQVAMYLASSSPRARCPRSAASSAGATTPRSCMPSG